METFTRRISSSTISTIRKAFCSNNTLCEFNYLSGNHPKPSFNKKYFRLYGHKLCAFAERAALAFVLKEIDFQYVNVDLTCAADWHKEINGGALPLLETPDEKIYFESAHLIEFAEEIHKNKGIQLIPTCPYQKLEMRLINEKFNQFPPTYYKFLLSKGKESDSINEFLKVLPAMEKFISQNLNGKMFLNGKSEISYLDIHAFVFFERILMFRGSPYHEFLGDFDFDVEMPQTQKWVSNIRSMENLENFILPQDKFHDLLKRYLELPVGIKAKLSL